MSGLELQSELTAHGANLPTIVMTGYGDVPTCARAFKGGVFDFIEKPADDVLLLDRITAAMALSAQDRERCADAGELTTRLERLTPRQQEVLDLLIAGTPLKLVASRLATGPSPALTAFHDRPRPRLHNPDYSSSPGGRAQSAAYQPAAQARSVQRWALLALRVSVGP